MTQPATWSLMCASVQVLTGFGEDETPQFRSPSRPITIRHLLTHTAGFAYDFHNETTARYVATLPPAQRWTQAYFEDPLVFDPGEGWAYGAGIDWLGQVVEAVAGERLDTYFERHILGPLGMKDTTFTPSSTQVQRLATNHSRTADGLEPDPYPVPPEDIEFHAGGQGLYGTASDYLRLTRMLLNGGTLDNERILTPETVALMFADQLDSTMPSGDRRFGPQVAADLAAFVQEDSGWGLSFQIHRQGRPNRRSPGALSWMGACNTFFWIDPAQHLTGVFTTQVTPLLDPLTVKAFGRFERAVYDTFGHGIPG